MSTALMWFRNDLRVDDNSALHAALGGGHERVGALFYATPQQWREHDMAPVKGEFLWRNLENLRTALRTLGVPLFVRVVPGFAAIAEDLVRFAADLQCTALYANREYAVNEARRDEAVADALQPTNISWRLFDDATLLPPGSVRTRQGQPFKVFTPFKRAALEQLEIAPLHCVTPKRQRLWREPPPLPTYPYESSTVKAALWPAGERAAVRRLQQFIESDIGRYEYQRDFPALAATSRLSPYLALGVISPRRCAQAALAVNMGQWREGDRGVVIWLNELLWRDFYQHVLAEFPRVSKHRPLQSRGDNVRWRYDERDFRAWCDGETGYPLVDAAMRQLRQTGWMHNRLRMITAMFLSKYLLLDWRWGERHFMRHLIDGDLAANNGGWQWSASTGTDAAPYFRLLNPLRQAGRFDADGVFCKRFLPSLRRVPVKSLLQPGHPDLLAVGYPPPIVDLSMARARVLEAFADKPPRVPPECG